jgi:CheY-like chemotaxis protein
MITIDHFWGVSETSMGSGGVYVFNGRDVPAARPAIHRVLLVDDDEPVLEMMTQSLECNGFSVVGVGGVTDALKRIATEGFDILITDLHMPNAGDGFTVISAMRHSQPAALTMLLSGFPDVKRAKDDERTGHLPKLIEDLVIRLNRPIAGAPQDSDAICSPGAVLHGELRFAQGYTPGMVFSRTIGESGFATAFS